MDSPEEHANEKRIALWPARTRGRGDNHPYLTGWVTIEGQKYFVTLWKRHRDSDRQPMLSGEVTPAVDSDIDTELREKDR